MNEDTPNIPNHTEPGFCPKRNEKEYCPLCGQHWALCMSHINIPGNATEPPETWCCEAMPDDEHEPFNPFDDNSHDLPRAAGDYWENLDIQF